MTWCVFIYVTFNCYLHDVGDSGRCCCHIDVTSIERILTPLLRGVQLRSSFLETPSARPVGDSEVTLSTISMQVNYRPSDLWGVGGDLYNRSFIAFKSHCPR